MPYPHPSATIRLSATPPRVPAAAPRTLHHFVGFRNPLPVERSVLLAARMLEALQSPQAISGPLLEIHPACVRLLDGDHVELVARPCTNDPLGAAFPYQAPEVLRGLPATDASRSYSIAVILFQMLTGSLPFDAPNAYLMLRKQLEEPPPALQSFGVTVPDGLEAVLRRALEKDPARRYASTCQFRDALDPFLPVSLMQTRVTKAYTATPSRSHRSDLGHWIALAALFLVSALYLAFSASERPHHPTDDPLARHPLPLAFEPRSPHR